MAKQCVVNKNNRGAITSVKVPNLSLLDQLKNKMLNQFSNRSNPLIVSHQIKEEDLIKNKKNFDGNLPLPSLGISSLNSGYTSSEFYGNITLLIEPSILDTSSVYTQPADFYSPVVPRAEPHFELDAYKQLGDQVREQLPVEIQYLLDEPMAFDSAMAQRNIVHNRIYMLSYLINEQGKEITLDNASEEMMAVRRNEDYIRYAQQLNDFFTSDLEMFSDGQGNRLPFTLENVTSYMQEVLESTTFMPSLTRAELKRQQKDIITYAESKVKEPLHLSSFKYAIVPTDISQEALEILESNGIQVIQTESVQDRINRLTEITQTDPNISFSREGNNMVAIERNNGHPLYLAPNGEPSLLFSTYRNDMGLTIEQALHEVSKVYTDNFGQFFGRWWEEGSDHSQVVDVNGQPKIVWSGHPDKPSEYKGYRDVYEEDGYQRFSPSAFFVEDRRLAQSYSSGSIDFFALGKEQAKKIPETGSVVPAFLNIRNKKTVPKNSYDIIPEISSSIQEGIDGFYGDSNYKSTYMTTPVKTWSVLDGNQVYEVQTGNDVMTQEVTNRLMQKGLVNQVHLLSNEELDQRLQENLPSSDNNVYPSISVYHGSPHRFDRFSTEFMGTGEGNQAFGWGLYFTDIESIARAYASARKRNNSVQSLSNNLQAQLWDRENLFKNLKITKNGIEGIGQLRKGLNVAVDEKSSLKKSLLTDNERLEIQKYLDTDPGKNFDYLRTAMFIDGRIRNFFNYQDSKSVLYNVSLHKGKAPSEYTWLEWDKSLTEEQFEKIIIRDYMFNGESGIYGDVLDYYTNGFSADYNNEISSPLELIEFLKEEGITGKEIYDILKLNSSAKEASLKLLNAGIDGIKYPAESISRGTTSDNARGFNYVVFDENAVTIEENIQFNKESSDNIGTTPVTNGFYKKDTQEIFLNKDSGDLLNTTLHEFAHPLLQWLQQNNPEVFNAGIEVIKNNQSEAQRYIDRVDTLYPNLTKDSNAYWEEVMAEIVANNGVELVQSQKQNNIEKWLENLWSTIKNMLGITNYTPEQVSQMTLREFANAVNAEMLNGNNLNNNNEQQGINRVGEQRRDRTRWDSRRGPQTLEGAPINTKRKNVTGADPELTYWAEEYARRNGINYKRQSRYVTVDVGRATMIAEAYDEMEHAPNDPVVKEAYENLIRQTLNQYNILVEGGYQFYFFDETNDPYDGNPMAAMEELRNDKKMGSFATESGFGTGNEGLDVSDNPLLMDTGIEWGYGSVDGPKKRVLANDVFRAVHDAFGHGLEGAGFRARGEENAWQAHARLFTGSAVAAITSETRGQNSWLNFGKHSSHNRNAKVEDTIFAPQKTGLMPEWTWKEGYDEGVEIPNINPQIEVQQNDFIPSQLYEELKKQPFFTESQALEAYKNIYSKQAQFWQDAELNC